MIQLMNNKVIWLVRVILLWFTFVFQITFISASPGDLGLNPYSPISDVYTYDEVKGAVKADNGDIGGGLLSLGLGILDVGTGGSAVGIKTTGSTMLNVGIKGLINPKKTVVIGEDMANRVIPFAEKNGYKYFKPRGKNPKNWINNQKQWINRQIRDSKTEIIDIGPKGSQPTSVYYKIELNEIKKLKK